MGECAYSGDFTEFAAKPLADIDAESLRLFLHYARASSDWRGNPEVEDCARVAEQLSQLKRAGLLATVPSGAKWIIHFTGAGRYLAYEHGVVIPH